MSDPQQRKLFNTSSMTSTAMMRRVKRPAMEEPYKKPIAINPNRMGRSPTDIELHMPDEDRRFWIKAKRCPACGCYASLIREKVRGQIMFKVRCNDVEKCGNSTEYFKSSQDAFRKWQLTAILCQ